MLAAIGGLTGLGYNALVSTGRFSWTDDPIRLALGAMLLGSAIAFAFVAERRRIGWAAGFALASGLVIGLVTWWTGGLNDGVGKEPWHLVCALLAVAIAAPLFQVARDEEAWRFPYRAVHGHAWTNVVLWFAAWLFVLATYLLLYMLGSLFDLIGIGLLSRLLRENWFWYLAGGAAFGGAVGLLRERDRVLVTLQRVVTAVSGVLAPVLALGLILFLLAIPFKGITLLWQTTKYATPILLSCIVTGLILANAVLGDSKEDEPRSPILRWGAIGLGATMLPLALIAAISTGKRIHQYGLTPDRLWAVTFVAIATAYGLAYLVALIRRRQDWGETARAANLTLAFAVCATSLVLATPLAAFGAVSAHDQLARIRDGRTPPERIDFAALAFDMGSAGRDALASLGRDGPSEEIRKMAKAALAGKTRWTIESLKRHPDVKALAAQARIFPAGATIPPELWSAIPDYNSCAIVGSKRHCVIRIWPDRGVASVIAQGCETCPPNTDILYRRADGSWDDGHRLDLTSGDSADNDASRKAEAARQWAAIEHGEIEIRPVTQDYLFIANGKDSLIDPPSTPPAPAKH
jgi:hypothetical protein